MINNIQNYYALIASLATVIAIVVAMWQFKDWVEKKRSDLIRILKILKVNVSIIGSWTSLEKGGYHKVDLKNAIKDKFKAWGNPFTQVFPIGESINQIPLLPEFEKLSDDLNETIASLNQEITSFNSYLEDIRQFKYSDPKTAIDIHLKINGVIKEELTDYEMNYAKKLTEMYIILHFEMIADEKEKRLFFWCKKLHNILPTEEKKIMKKEKIYYLLWILSIIFLFLLLLPLINIFVRFLNSFYCLSSY